MMMVPMMIWASWTLMIMKANLEYFYAVIDWAYKIDPFRCISMHGITSIFLVRKLMQQNSCTSCLMTWNPEFQRNSAGLLRKLVTRLKEMREMFGKWVSYHIYQVNFPVKNLELKDYIPLPAPKGNERLRSKYDLIANFVHDGRPGEGSYKVFVQRKSEELWIFMSQETMPQMVALSEAYMQIYEQQQ